jgi:hypothetical protein
MPCAFIAAIALKMQVAMVSASFRQGMTTESSIVMGGARGANAPGWATGPRGEDMADMEGFPTGDAGSGKSGPRPAPPRADLETAYATVL